MFENQRVKRSDLQRRCGIRSIIGAQPAAGCFELRSLHASAHDRVAVLREPTHRHTPRLHKETLLVYYGAVVPPLCFFSSFSGLNLISHTRLHSLSCQMHMWTVRTPAEAWTRESAPAKRLQVRCLSVLLLHLSHESSSSGLRLRGLPHPSADHYTVRRTSRHSLRYSACHDRGRGR